MSRSGANVVEPTGDPTARLRVVAHRGLPYADVLRCRPLELDLYVPAGQPGAPELVPLLVFVHGGGWARGSRRSFGPAFDEGFFARIAGGGYVVASIDYRLSGEAVYPAQLQDVHVALDWLAEHAPAHGADIERTVLLGESAGGHLAALAGLTCRTVRRATTVRRPRHGPVVCASSASSTGTARATCAPWRRRRARMPWLTPVIPTPGRPCCSAGRSRRRGSLRPRRAR